MIRRLGLVLLLTACTERVELVGELDSAVLADGAGGAAGCSIGGESCGACDDAGCVRARCRTAGESCGSSADCCSHRCEQSFCVASEGCAVVGESCGASAFCCSGACATNEVGRVVCHGLGGCAPAGEICRADEDCCEAAGGPGACEIFDVAAGVGRCRAPARCAQSGELCAGGGVDCCPGGEASQELCQPTAIAAVQRCVSESARVMCLPPNARCASPSECCSEVCARDEAGALVCSEGCIGEARRCTRDADCCEGACEAGVCRRIHTGCLALGARCASSDACCSGLCDGETGACSSPLG